MDDVELKYWEEDLLKGNIKFRKIIRALYSFYAIAFALILLVPPVRNSPDTLAVISVVVTITSLSLIIPGMLLGRHLKSIENKVSIEIELRKRRLEADKKT